MRERLEGFCDGAAFVGGVAILAQLFAGRPGWPDIIPVAAMTAAWLLARSGFGCRLILWLILPLGSDIPAEPGDEQGRANHFKRHAAR